MIITAGYLSAISSLADKSIKITISTQEISSDKIGQLFEIKDKYIKILFSEENISNDIEDSVKGLELVSPSKHSKSKSNRLRNVLYRIWEKQEIKSDFDEYYENQMEIIINHFKSKIN